MSTMNMWSVVNHIHSMLSRTGAHVIISCRDVQRVGCSEVKLQTGCHGIILKCFQIGLFQSGPYGKCPLTLYRP